MQCGNTIWTKPPTHVESNFAKASNAVCLQQLHPSSIWGNSEKKHQQAERKRETYLTTGEWRPGEHVQAAAISTPLSPPSSSRAFQRHHPGLSCPLATYKREQQVDLPIEPISDWRSPWRDWRKRGDSPESHWRNPNQRKTAAAGRKGQRNLRWPDTPSGPEAPRLGRPPTPARLQIWEIDRDYSSGGHTDAPKHGCLQTMTLHPHRAPPPPRPWCSPTLSSSAAGRSQTRRKEPSSLGEEREERPEKGQAAGRWIWVREGEGKVKGGRHLGCRWRKGEVAAAIGAAERGPPARYEEEAEAVWLGGEGEDEEGGGVEGIRPVTGVGWRDGTSERTVQWSDKFPGSTPLFDLFFFHIHFLPHKKTLVFVHIHYWWECERAIRVYMTSYVQPKHSATSLGDNDDFLSFTFLYDMDHISYLFLLFIWSVY